MNSRAFSVAVLAVVLALSVLAMPASMAAQDQGNVLTVGPGEQYATIQAAVVAAKQGDRILVYPTPGTYREVVVIHKNNLQILAQGEHVNVQPPIETPDTLPEDQRSGFVVIADNVTIRGFNIGFGGGCFPAIYFHGSHNTFADNYMFQDEDCLGINAVNGRSPNGGNDNNVLEGNTIYHADLGIAIGAGTGFLNKGNVIRNNIIRNIYTTPIGIENGDGFLVSGNRIEGGAGFCIDVGTVQELKQPPQGHHTIVNNYMEGCSQKGIWLYANELSTMTNNRVADNRIVGCSTNCIALTAYAGASVSNNEVSSNSMTPSTRSALPTSGDGIVLEVVEPRGAVNDNLIQGNSVSFGGDGIVVTAGADKNRIFKNEVRSNLGVGISVAGNNNSMVDNVAKNNNLANSGLWDLADFGQGNRWINNTYDTSNF
jgi:parallel beta-helix repeat protein